MENDRATTVIAAGCAENMAQFLNSNPGLRSRFGSTEAFEHFDGPKLGQESRLRVGRGRAWRARSGVYATGGSAPKGWAHARSAPSILHEAVTA